MRRHIRPAAPRPPTFVEFCTSLGARFTDAQRVLVTVVFDGSDPIDLRQSDREISRQLFGNVDRIDPVARAVLALVAGARSGKTWIAGLYLLWRASVADLSSLAAGEHAFGLVLAPDLRLSRQLLRYVDGAARHQASPLQVVGSTTESITLQRPGDQRLVTVEIVPVGRAGAAARGRSLIGAVLDESAFMLDEDHVAADAHSFAAVTPRVMPGGMVLVQSTPWMRAGLLFELVERNEGKPHDAIAVVAPTALMRAGDPAITLMLERERRRNAKNFAREYGAKFLDAEGTLFDPGDVDRCVDVGVTSRLPQPDVMYAITIDIGLRRDWTSVLVFHVEDRRRENAPPQNTLVIDAVRVLKPKIFARVTLDDVEDAIVGLATRYEATIVGGDLHYADAIGPRIKARGLEFRELKMGSIVQERRAESLAARIAAKSIRLVDHPDLIKQLKNLREVRHPGGRTTIGAPERKGQHDDVADTTLLACELARELPSSGAGSIVMGINYSHEAGCPMVLEPVFYEQQADGTMRECLPPVGTQARRDLAERYRAEGTITRWMLEDEARFGDDPDQEDGDDPFKPFERGDANVAIEND